MIADKLQYTYGKNRSNSIRFCKIALYASIYTAPEGSEKPVVEANLRALFGTVHTCVVTLSLSKTTATRGHICMSRAATFARCVSINDCIVRRLPCVGVVKVNGSQLVTCSRTPWYSTSSSSSRVAWWCNGWGIILVKLWSTGRECNCLRGPVST